MTVEVLPSLTTQSETSLLLHKWKKEKAHIPCLGLIIHMKTWSSLVVHCVMSHFQPQFIIVPRVKEMWESSMVHDNTFCIKKRMQIAKGSWRVLVMSKFIIASFRFLKTKEIRTKSIFLFCNYSYNLYQTMMCFFPLCNSSFTELQKYVNVDSINAYLSRWLEDEEK